MCVCVCVCVWLGGGGSVGSAERRKEKEAKKDERGRTSSLRRIHSFRSFIPAGKMFSAHVGHTHAHTHTHTHTCVHYKAGKISCSTYLGLPARNTILQLRRQVHLLADLPGILHIHTPPERLRPRPLHRRDGGERRRGVPPTVLHV